jgi:GT2 family glycosyltransferase
VSSATVGVLIVNWNSGTLLARCLDTLQDQTRRPDHILVVDNASDDGSERTALDRQGVDLLRMPRNLGFAEANNVGAERLADCDWVALLNPDAFAEPGWLEALMAHAGRAPEFASFASRQVLFDQPGLLDGSGDVYTVAGLAWRRDHGRPANARSLKNEEVFGACAAAALYRRDVFLACGGFDVRYFCYFEDVDLAFRLRLRGYRCLYVADAIVHHVGSALTGFRSDFAVFHGQRNMVWTFFKDMPATLLVLYLPHHILMNIASLLVLGARGQGGTALRAKWAALRGLRTIMASRRILQRERTASAAHVRGAMVRGLRAFGIGR